VALKPSPIVVGALLSIDVVRPLSVQLATCPLLGECPKRHRRPGRSAWDDDPARAQPIDRFDDSRQALVVTFGGAANKLRGEVRVAGVS
jgi:hypothetical protein